MTPRLFASERTGWPCTTQRIVGTALMAFGILVAGGLPGCGYHFVSATLPGDIDCIRVGRVANETQESALDITLRRALEDRLDTLGVQCTNGARRFGQIDVIVEAFTLSQAFVGTGEEHSWVTGAYRMEARVVARLSRDGRGNGKRAAVVVTRTFPASLLEGGARGLDNTCVAQASWAEASDEVADRVLYGLLGVGEVTRR